MENNNMNTNHNELNNDKLVGVFQTEQQASQAIEELKASGINKDNISVIAKDKKDLKHISEETGTKAPEGIATGAAAGGTIGGVAGLLAGIGMMAIPVFGPIMAAGPIAVTLAGAAAGAAGGGLVGGLIGLGIPEDQAKEYENNVKEGQILVLVDEQTGRQKTVYDIFRKNQASNTKYYDTDTTATAASVPTATTEHEVTAENVGNGRFDLGEDEQTLRLREEQLNVSKTRAQTGEVEVHKEVIEEQKVVNVPVSHEEVVVERKAVNNEATSEPIGSGEAIRVPVTEEQVEVNKRNVVTGEVEVHKQTVQGTEQVQDTVKHEEARVTRNGEPIVNEGRIGEERNTLNLPKK